jgi:hypothetical protein
VTAACALLSVLAGTSNGCSSSTVNSVPNDAESDGIPIHHPDGSSVDAGPGDDTGGGEASTMMTFDGTTGQPCMNDAQCKGVGPGAPGVNKCSTSILFTGGELYPSGVCLMPVKCDPCGGTVPCDQYIHGCDGVDPSAPGICLPLSAGGGICLPACSYKADGTAPVGCVGKDVCQPYGFGTQPYVNGVGYCYGGCTADTDCITGEKCDLLTGLCLKTVTPPTMNIGDPCTMAQANMSPPPCNCIYNTMTGNGLCTKVCTVGGSQCPTGWMCETQEPTALPGANDASVPGFMTPNMGLGGFCVPSCQVDGGAMGTDSGVCPMGTTCRADFAGGAGCIP